MTVDRCIYMKVVGSKFIILVLYVDDILLAASDRGLLHDVKNYLSSNIEMKDMGEASYVIGIEIFWDRSQGILGLSQKAYINKVLEDLRWNHVHLVQFPSRKETISVYPNVPKTIRSIKKWIIFLMLL